MTKLVHIKEGVLLSREDIIRQAQREFVYLAEQSNDVGPEDGLRCALEACGQEDMIEEEYMELLYEVENACIEKGLWEYPQTEPFQMLPGEIFSAKFEDFKVCEKYWRPVSEKNKDAFVKALDCVGQDYSLRILGSYLTMRNEWSRIEKGERTGITVEAAAEGLLEAGRVVSLPIGFLRKVTSRIKCPKCGCSIMDDMPALSRIDNKTELCAICSTEEALSDYFHEG